MSESSLREPAARASSGTAWMARARLAPAVSMARAQGANLELHIFGNPDPANPSSYSGQEIDELISGKPGVVWHGVAARARDVWLTHDIALLLSRREGLPRTLVEAAASGRAMVATDVPGCREVVRNGVDGYLVPLDDIPAAATALRRLAHDLPLRTKMGLLARRRFEERFTEARVRAVVGSVYRELMEPAAEGACASEAAE